MAETSWDALQAEAIGWLKDLLRIDTTNPPGNELAAARFLAGVLEREGIEHRIVEAAPGRASLIARLGTRGPGGALLLNGHLDVVPAERERWTHDPFAAVEADGCIWGRGAIDMKNMVAMSLASLVRLRRRGVPLARVSYPRACRSPASHEVGSVGGRDFIPDPGRTAARRRALRLSRGEAG
jgi:acetylornithine deacetylase/succinyl-diaminopimelate desuccinylase-like protein